MKVDRKKNNLLEFILDLADLDGKVLKVGWVSKKQYPPRKKITRQPDGSEKITTVRSNFTTAEVGYIAEFGSPKRNIPPRRIMTPTNAERKDAWKTINAYEVRKIFKGEQTIGGALETIGLVVAGDYRKKITEIWEPPLAARTIRERIAMRNIGRKVKIKSSDITTEFMKPLIFDGIFLNSVAHSVETEK